MRLKTLLDAPLAIIVGLLLACGSPPSTSDSPPPELNPGTSDSQGLEDPTPQDPNSKAPDPEPENPDPENPDPENPDPENPEPENPDPENPDPENPDPDNPDPENPDPEDPEPEDPPVLSPAPTTYEIVAECGTASSFTLEELDTLVIRTDCDAPQAMAPLPTEAVVEGGVVTWTPMLDQAGESRIAFLGANNEETTVNVMVLDRFDHPENEPVQDPSTYREEFGLPVFHLKWHSDDPDFCNDAISRDSVPSDIMVNGIAFEDTELRCRGATSLAYPKKSFTLKFSKNKEFVAPPALQQFDGRRRLILTQTFDDVSQLRTRLAFELWNQLDPARPLQIDHGSVVVFVDGHYRGVYQITDKIDDHLFKLRGLNKNSNSYKGAEHEANLLTTFNGTEKSPLWLGYEKDEGEPADDFTDLVELLQWVTNSTDEEFEQSIDDRLFTEDFLDWHVLVTLINATDNSGKNTFLIRDPKKNADQRFRFAPWDFNASFGQSWRSFRSPPETGMPLSPDNLNEHNGLWNRMAFIPSLLARLDTRFRDALAGPASEENMLARLDTLAAQIRPAALRDDRRWDAERRSFPRWSERTDFTLFDEEVAYVRNWISVRTAYIKQHWLNETD